MSYIALAAPTATMAGVHVVPPTILIINDENRGHDMYIEYTYKTPENQRNIQFAYSY